MAYAVRSFRCLFCDAESVDSFLCIYLAWVEDHRREVGSVWRIREVLSFEAYRTAFRECSPVLSFISVSPVVCVHLHAGFCCPAFESSAAVRFSDACCKAEFSSLFLVQDKAVVVAVAVLQLFVVGIDVLPYCLWSAEVEWCAFNFQNLAGRDARLVYGEKSAFISHTRLSIDGVGLAMPVSEKKAWCVRLTMVFLFVVAR